MPLIFLGIEEDDMEEKKNKKVILHKYSIDYNSFQTFTIKKVIIVNYAMHMKSPRTLEIKNKRK